MMLRRRPSVLVIGLLRLIADRDQFSMSLHTGFSNPFEAHVHMLTTSRPYNLSAGRSTPPTMRSVRYARIRCSWWRRATSHLRKNRAGRGESVDEECCPSSRTAEFCALVWSGSMPLVMPLRSASCVTAGRTKTAYAAVSERQERIVIEGSTGPCVIHTCRGHGSTQLAANKISDKVVLLMPSRQQSIIGASTQSGIKNNLDKDLTS